MSARAEISAAGPQDEERLKKALNQVPSNEELNAMLARSADELVLFNRLDRDMEWPDEQGMHPLQPAFSRTA